MSPKRDNREAGPLFPILRGESVGHHGEFTGYAVIVKSPTQLRREWRADHIAVLDSALKTYLSENPNEMECLFAAVSAVLSEFGESIGDSAAMAYVNECIYIVKVSDASHVLEDGMHIRVVAHENLGEVFFID
ncbi:MAG: hypothetical protein HXY34_10730 [Candidatus Thorarchaeota archaeon]|nr:hypothetical protein [Candidatus Thorarchaeota archaeon]